jgi:hypothetical protein
MQSCMDTHHFGSKTVEPDPQQSEKQDPKPDPHRSKNFWSCVMELKMEQWRAVPVDTHNVGLEAQNEVVKVGRPVVAGSNHFDEEHNI